MLRFFSMRFPPRVERIGLIFWKCFLLLAVLLTVFFSNVRWIDSDPRATLLVSESILKHGTIRLDHYGDEVLDRYGYVIREKNGHRYNYFPIGTALVSLPFVAVANLCGLNMVESEPLVQRAIVLLWAPLTLLLLIQMAQLFFPPFRAGLIAAVYWFGTSLASTCGTALWSHNFAVLFAVAAIYCVLLEHRNTGRFRWVYIALCLLGAYLCRPNMALLVPMLLLFYFLINRRGAILAGLLLGMLLACFSLFCLCEYGQILPDYYLPSRLLNPDMINRFPAGIPRTGFFWRAIYGNLMSPARGLLVFSSFIIFSWAVAPKPADGLKVNRLWMLVGIAWPLVHLVIISTYPHWWGGGCFGARLMTDVLPGLFLIPLCSPPPPRALKRVGMLLFAVGAIFSVYIHSVQGLYNPYTIAWNAEPNVDKNSEYIFNWKYPQFLHNQRRHQARIVEHALPRIKRLVPGEQYSHSSPDLVFAGWSGDEPGHRWSEGTEVHIYFKVNLATSTFQNMLLIEAGTLGKQHVELELNGSRIFGGLFDQWDLSIRQPFSPSLLREGINHLCFRLPDARKPDNGDPRILALALRSLCLQ